MAKKKKIDHGIKYTIVLPEKDIENLKELVDVNQVPSVNAAVREAVEEYIVKSRKDLYRKGLMEAVKDKDFIERTNDCTEFYKDSDNDAEEIIEKW